MRKDCQRCRRGFQFAQEEHRLLARVAAHLARRRQAAADARPFGVPENAAAVVLVQLHAAHAGRLAVRHAGNRGRDRRGDAARAAAGAAGNGGIRGMHVKTGDGQAASILPTGPAVLDWPYPQVYIC